MKTYTVQFLSRKYRSRISTAVDSQKSQTCVFCDFLIRLSSHPAGSIPDRSGIGAQKTTQGEPMIRKTRLYTPGPTPLLPAAQFAMAAADIHHRTPEFRALYQKVLAQLKV